MKYIMLLLIGLFSFSCSNELNVIEEKKDIPIVYGFLAASDSTQYIRIERAFVDESISALDLAQIPDSLYYDQLDVSLLDETTGIEVNLNRIDGNLEGFPREEGAFAQDPNYLYKLDAGRLELDDSHTYQLKIIRGENLPLVTARTNIVGESNLITPNPLSLNPVLDFDVEGGNTTFSWGSGENATIYDLFLNVNYDERPIGGVYESKQFTWNVASNLSTVSYRQDGVEFYTKLASNLEEDSNLERRFRGCDVIIVAGNAELQEYLRVGQANLGITSTQDVPIYTNLSEGRGIFASRFTTKLEEVKLTPKSLELLANGSITKALNFRI